MTNYLLFKQIVSLILFFETLILWPRFYRYFGPLAFPRSLFTTTLRITIFNFVLLINLASIFLNYYSLIGSFFLVICMRYLFVTDASQRISTLGAVGHVCYIVSVYIFFFELSLLIDPSLELTSFFKSVFAIEIGIIMFTAGVFKFILGYTKGKGFEYALVNPNWSKFFFFFNKMSPSSLFFKINNYAAFLGEIFSGILFFIPQTRIFGAYILIFLFLYVFITVRVNVLALLMMSAGLLYIQPFAFHFPTFESAFPVIVAPQIMITLIEAIFIIYLAAYICICAYRLLLNFFTIKLPNFLLHAMQIFMKYRPYFEWSVFTTLLTNFFVKIEKTSLAHIENTSTIYDGFSKEYREIAEDPRMFFRFVHHHESSFILNIFVPFYTAKKEENQQYMDLFTKKMGMYGKTLVATDDDNAVIIYTFMHISKRSNRFIYKPLYSYYIDLKTGHLIKFDLFN